MQTKYSVVFDIREIHLDGKSFQFSPPKTLTFNPNAKEIEQVFLDDEKKVGVQYFLTEQLDTEGRKLLHNAVFYQFASGSWAPLTELNHREAAKLDQSTYWRIATTVDGINRFSVEFSYTLTVL